MDKNWVLREVVPAY